MAVLLDQFVETLSQSGLMTADDARAFLEGLPDDEKPESGKELAKLLYQRGKLTKFQTQCVYQGKTKGLVLGKYVVLDEVGAGGMGHVYKAQHQRMKRVVALKVLPASVAKDSDAIRRFQREVEAAARLVHQNIVVAYDADESDGRHFLVMEFVEGRDLTKTIQHGGRLSVAKAIDYILQAARGLEYAHAQGIVHRDIKPSNLVLDKSGTVKILDMGLARFEQSVGPHSSGAGTLTQTGQVMGTIDYLPPEQAEDTHRVDHRADIYSLGCTLFTLLIGRSIYQGETLMTKMLAHREAEIPSLAQFREEVPEQLDRIFQKMVAKRPDDRHASMSEVIAELESCQASLSGQILNTPTLAQGPTNDSKPGSDVSQLSPGQKSMADDSRLDAWLKAEVPSMAPSVPRRPAPQMGSLRRFGRPAWIAMAVGFFGIVVLSVILSLRTSDGTVTVETPNGKLPADVKLIISGDGEQAEITSADRWKIDISPGVYKAELHGGGDRFTIENSTITVARAGKTILIVRRKSEKMPEARVAKVDPPQEPPVSPTPKPPEVTAHPSGVSDADLLARLADVDWNPGPADDNHHGMVTSPAAIDNLPGSWQIRQSYFPGPTFWLSPKGTYGMVVLPSDPTGVIIETKTGLPVGSIRSPDGHGIKVCAWSNDETRIAFASTSRNKSIHFVNRDGVTGYSSFPVEASGGQLVWSPDDSRIAIGGGSLAIYSTSGELLHSHKQQGLQLIEWSPDGRHIVVYRIGSKQIVEVATGKVLIDTSTRGLVGYRWTSDGQLLVCRQGKDPSQLNAEISDDAIRYVPQEEIHVATSPDGRFSVTRRGAIRDAAGEVRTQLDMSLVPSYLGYSKRPIHIDWDEPDRIRVVSREFPGCWAEYSPVGQVLDFGQRPVGMPFPYASWLDDEQRIITAHAGCESMKKKGRQFLWSVDGTNDSTCELAKGSGYEDQIRATWGFASPVPIPHTRACAASIHHNTFHIFDDQGQIVSGFAGRDESSFSPDGKSLAIFTPGKSIIIRRGGETVHQFETDFRNYASPVGLIWNVDGTHLCAWSRLDRSAYVWNVKEEKLIEKRDGWANKNWAPQWSPDGARLAMFSDEKTLLLKAIDGREDLELDWTGRNIEFPIFWTPDGNALMVGGKIHGLDGQQIGTIKDMDGTVVEFHWLGSTNGAIGVRGQHVLLWSSVEEQPAEILVAPPGSHGRDRFGPKEYGVNLRQLSSSGRYFVTIAGYGGVHGNVALVDLQEKKVVWIGIAFDDGMMIRMSESGKILTELDDVDRYLFYTIRYPEGFVVPMTRLQFAARIGLSPAGQCLQRILDFGGKLQLAGRKTPLARADLKDARDLPEPSEVVGVSFVGSHHVTADTLEPLKELASLTTLDLSSTQVSPEDIESLRKALPNCEIVFEP